MNENEIDRVAAATNALRPDWPTASIRTLIVDKLANRARRDVAVALAWVACESASKTPARVLEAGPWWRATGVEDGGSAPRPPKPHEACRDCGRHLDSCLCPDGPTLHAVVPLPNPTPRVARLREIARDATAGHCAHGVPRTNCIDHRAKADPPTEGDA